MKEIKEYIMIDFTKLICSFLVLAIHLVPFCNINETFSYFFNHSICRLAVPFFFLCSGFFIFNKIKDGKEVAKYILKIFMMYVFVTILYLQIIISYDGFTLKNFVKSLFTTGSYVQLWYLPALIFSVVAIYFLVNKLKVRDSYLIVLSIILYILGALGNTYKEWLFSLSDSEMLHMYYNVFGTTRNGLFFATPFVIAGYLIKKNYHKFAEIGTLKCFVIFAALLFLMTIECFLVKNLFTYSEKDALLLLLPTAVMLFIAIAVIECNNSALTQWAVLARNLSITIYLLHMFVYYYSYQAFLESLLSAGEAYLLTICITLVMGCLIEWLSIASEQTFLKFNKNCSKIKQKRFA